MEYDDYGRVYSATNLIDYLASSTVYNAIVSAYYEYNNDDTLKYEQTTLPSGGLIRTDYEYDDFLRVTGMSRTSGSFSQSIGYTYYSQNNNTTGLISGYTSTVNGNQIGFSYAYDSKGNITTIVDPNNDVTTYTYDDLGQLLSEVKGNVTKTYTYDNAGNITSITTRTERQPLDPDPGFKPIIKAAGTVPTVVTTTKTLSYSDSQWGDLFTSFDGHTITYDEIGNPLSYYNGTDYTFTWDGRRLVGAVSGSKTMSFTYNEDGIRTSKTVNGVTTTYYVNGSPSIAERYFEALAMDLLGVIDIPTELIRTIVEDMRGEISTSHSTYNASITVDMSANAHNLELLSTGFPLYFDLIRPHPETYIGNTPYKVTTTVVYEAILGSYGDNVFPSYTITYVTCTILHNGMTVTL